MKLILTIILAVSLFLNAKSQDTAQIKKHLPAELENQYCASFKKGRMILKANEKEINKDVTLLNGDRLTSNCAIIKKDGSMITLKPGECVDKNGNITGVDKTSGMKGK